MQDSVETRAKKLAGALNRVPKPKELRERFAEKGTELSLGEARSLYSTLNKWWPTRGTKAISKSKPGPKSKNTRRSRSKVTRAYGPR